MTAQGLPLPGPAGSTDVAVGPAAEHARRQLAGFPAARLLADVSVARAAGVVVDSVRDSAGWLRVMLAGLEEFRAAERSGRLSAILAAAWAAPVRAECALRDFAARIADAGPHELSRLGFGPKLWFTVNGVPINWHPLPGAGPVPHTPAGLRLTERDRLHAAERVLRRAGLTVAELARLRLRDLGRLAPGEVFVPDLLADPLAVRLRPAARSGGETGPWLVLLGHEARISVLTSVLTRYGPNGACRHGGERLLPDVDGTDDAG